MKTIKEGKAILYLPNNIKPTKSSEVFYNEKMKLNRDFSSIILNYLFNKKEINVYDMLASSGVRGIRYAKEYINGSVNVVFTEKNPHAFEYLVRNIRKNKISGVAYNTDARVYCLENADLNFDLVDVDCFGSHIHFTYFSGLVVDRLSSYIFVTVTDLGAILGRSKRACIRKYSSINDNFSIFRDDIALRILIASIARELLKHELGIKPVAYHMDRHFIRVFLRVSKKYINETIDKIGFYVISDEYNVVRFNETTENHGKIFGPMWIGELVNISDDILKTLDKMDLEFKGYFKKYFKILIDESKFQHKHPTVLAFSFRKFLTSIGISNFPKIDRLIEYLDKNNIDCTRSATFRKEGIRSNVNILDLKSLIKKFK